MKKTNNFRMKIPSKTNHNISRKKRKTKSKKKRKASKISWKMKKNNKLMNKSNKMRPKSKKHKNLTKIQKLMRSKIPTGQKKAGRYLCVMAKGQMRRSM